MRAFASRLIDARNTVEGRILSVLLSVLLVASLFNIGIFTYKANANEGELDGEPAVEKVDPVEDTIPVDTVKVPDTDFSEKTVNALSDDVFISEGSGNKAYSALTLNAGISLLDEGDKGDASSPEISSEKYRSMIVGDTLSTSTNCHRQDTKCSGCGASVRWTHASAYSIDTSSVNDKLNENLVFSEFSNLVTVTSNGEKYSKISGKIKGNTPGYYMVNVPYSLTYSFPEEKGFTCPSCYKTITLGEHTFIKKYITPFHITVSAYYALEYDTQGGTAIESTPVLIARDSASLPVTSKVPTKDGYEFLGWSTNKEAKVAEYKAGKDITLEWSAGHGTSTENPVAKTLYAVWAPREFSYTVNYLDKNTNDSIYKTVTEKAKYNDEIKADEKKVSIIGYTYDSANVESLTVGSDDKANVINLYYTPNNNTKYTVEYYYMNGNGAYPKAATKSDECTGTTNAKVAVSYEQKVPTKAGYAFDEGAANVLEGTIAADGTTVLKVYFKLQFTVAYDLAGGTSKSENLTFDSLDYGTETPTIDKPMRTGYEFGGWDKKIADTVTADVTYIAKWNANTDTAYTVEFYYMSDGKYSDQSKDTVKDAGVTNSLAKVTDNQKVPTKAGYAFDEGAANVLEGTIAADGTTVLKVYFKQQFTVSYNLAGGISASENLTFDSLDYGTETPTIDKPMRTGYEFVGWDKEIADTVTTNAEYVATWKRDTTGFKAIPYKGVYDADSHTVGFEASDENPLFDNEHLVFFNGTEWIDASQGMPSASQYTNVVQAAKVKIGVADKNNTILWEDDEATVTITKRPVTIQAEPSSKVFGSEDPEFKDADLYIADSQVTDDQRATMLKELGSIDRSVARSNAGTKDGEAVDKHLRVLSIKATAAKLNEEYTNFEFTVTPADFEITRQSINPDDPENPDVPNPAYVGVEVSTPEDVVYNSQSQKQPIVVTDVDGVELVKDVDYEITYSADTTNVGTVDVVITGKGSYTGEVTRAYRITPVEVTIVVDNAGKNVGENDPAFTGTITVTNVDNGRIYGRDLGSITYVRTNKTEEVGTYENIIHVSYTANKNYKVTEYPGTFVIAPANAPVIVPATVVPPAPVPPVAPGPGVAAPAPAPAEDITDDATPLAQNPEGEEEGEEEIIDDENPLGTFDVKHCWTHWVMLMGMLITAAYGIAVARRRYTFTKDLDDFEKSVTGETAKQRGTVTVRTGSHQAI